MFNEEYQWRAQEVADLVAQSEMLRRRAWVPFDPFTPQERARLEFYRWLHRRERDELEASDVS